MNQKSKPVSIVLLVICAFLCGCQEQQAARNTDAVVSKPADTPQAVISAEDLQKIEAAIPNKATVKPKKGRKLLVFSRCEGFQHRSIPYGIRVLELMAEKTGAFEIVESTDMSVFEPENLAQFDAVCFNNPSKLEFEGTGLRESLLDFVKAGGGIAGIHAATDNFFHWPEGAEMMGGLFDGHPWRSKGTWAVKVEDPSHPVAAAFEGKDFKINDEIYRIIAPYSRNKVRVLVGLDMTDETNLSADGVRATDKDVPISWVRSYGKGRVFYCSLGHNNHIFWNPTILQHYLDGIQFALGDLTVNTTPSGFDLSKLDSILEEIAAYEYGQDDAAFRKLDSFLNNAHDQADVLREAEKKFIEFLNSDAALAGKKFICKKLSIIGTEASADVLAGMLTDPAISDMARYALQRIPGKAVNEVLRKGLTKTNVEIKIGIINTLGRRRDKGSVDQLAELIHDPDEGVALAAVVALGRIADPQAAAALAKAKDTTTGKLQLNALDAYLKCADYSLAEGQQSKAAAIYKEIYFIDAPRMTRAAAFRGIVASAGDNARGLVIDALRGNDEVSRTVAIEFVKDIPGTGIIKVAAAKLPDLSTDDQVRLLSALGERGNSTAVPAMIEATKSDVASVRIEALKALATVGDESVVDLLSRTAANTKQDIQQAARNSLYRLSGPGIDQTITAGIPQAEAKIKVELIRAAKERRIKESIETLLKTATDTDSKVRLGSIKALKVVAGDECLTELTDLLINSKAGNERKTFEKTVAAVARKMADTGRQADTVLAALDKTNDVETVSSLLAVLGRIGNDKALLALRKALDDPNEDVQVAAIRALSDWPTAEIVLDMYKIAQTGKNQIQRVLALRGYIRLVGLVSDRNKEEIVKMYEQAIELSSSDSEIKMVLSGLSKIKAFSALQMAAGYLDNDNLKQEAAVAVVNIAVETRGRGHFEETRAMVNKVLEMPISDSLHKECQRALQRIKKLETQGGY